MRQGDKGGHVEALQQALKAKGFEPGPVDGVYGVRTQRALEAFQVRAGLDVGDVDAATYAALGLGGANPLPLKGKPDVGIWVDRWPRVDQEEQWANDIAALGVTSASLCMWPQGKPSLLWSFGHGHEKIGRVQAELRQRGIAVGWCLWGDGRKVAEQAAQAREMARLVSAYEDALPDWLEMDAEEAWTKHAGEAEAEAWLDGMAPIANDLRVNFVLPLRRAPPPSVQALLGSGRVTEATLQAYSAYLRDKTWTHDEVFRPGGEYVRRCCLAPAAVLGLAQGVRVRLGLAIYGQNHPAPHPTGRAALEATWEMTRDLGRWAHIGAGDVGDVGGRYRFWSSGNLTATSRAFIKSITGDGQ